MNINELITILKYQKNITKEEMNDLLTFSTKELQILKKGIALNCPIKNCIQYINTIKKYDMEELKVPYVTYNNTIKKYDMKEFGVQYVTLTKKKSWSIINDNFEILKDEEIAEIIFKDKKDNVEIYKGLFELANTILKNEIPISIKSLFDIMKDIKNINIFKKAVLKLHPYLHFGALLTFAKFENEEIGNLIIEDCLEVKNGSSGKQVFLYGKKNAVDILNTFLTVDTKTKFYNVKKLFNEHITFEIISNFAKIKDEVASELGFKFITSYLKEDAYLKNYRNTSEKEISTVNKVISILNEDSSDAQLMKMYDIFIERYKLDEHNKEFDCYFDYFLQTIKQSDRKNWVQINNIMSFIIDLKSKKILNLNEELLKTYLDALVLLSKNEQIKVDDMQNKNKTLTNHLIELCNLPEVNIEQINKVEIEQIKEAFKQIVESDNTYDEFLNVYEKDSSMALESAKKYNDMYNGKIDIKPNTMVISK